MDSPCDVPDEGVILIPYERLSSDALEGVMDEFISREGTDYGDYDYSLADKRDQVLQQIKQGKVVLLFDPVAESCHLVLASQLPPATHF